MAVMLKPSINAFALLECDDDDGDTRQDDAAASRPVNINKKQQPQMSVWKANKLKAEENAAKNKQQQPAASKTKTNTAANAGKSKMTHPKKTTAAKIQAIGGAGKKSKMPQQPAAHKAQVNKAAGTNAYASAKPAPATLTQVLFGNAYPSARALIYQNRKQSALAHETAKAGGAPTDEKKGANAKPNGAPKNDAPAPVKEETPAPVKPVLPPPPPPSLEDSTQFPALK